MLLDIHLPDLFLAVLLLAAVLSDLTARLIPNLLIGVGLAFALGWHFICSGVNGLIFSGQGLALGMLLLMVPFFLGGMGAGDVKLLGMVGAFVGADMVWDVFLWTALIGGAVSFLYLAASGRLLNTVKKVLLPLASTFLPRPYAVLSGGKDRTEPELYLPYGVIIALGTLASYWKSW